MAGTQALSASRTPAFTYEPHKLILVTEPGTRFYSDTVNDPISLWRVLDIAARGVKVAMLVRRTDAGDTVVDGRNRVKLGLVVNHLTGVHLYDGDLSSVHECIERIKGTDLETRIIELAQRRHGEGGVMIKALANNSGTDAEAEADGLAADEMRRGGSGYSWEVRARRAQQLIEAGQPIERVVESMDGVTVGTLRKWIAKLNAPPAAPKPARAATLRPKAKTLKRIFGGKNATPGLSLRESTLILFIMGGQDEAGLFRAFPELATPAKEEGEASV